MEITYQIYKEREDLRNLYKSVNVTIMSIKYI